MSKIWNLIFVFLLSTMGAGKSFSQNLLHGKVTAAGLAIKGATVELNALKITVMTDSLGYFRVPLPFDSGAIEVQISCIGYLTSKWNVEKWNLPERVVNFELAAYEGKLDEIVVTGTLKPVLRSQSPVPVEIYTQQFLRKNPTPSIFESLQHVNGVRPQINCSVCNTGDIHINGLEGPYTMVTIDGMPIVSSLSTVYGLFGIPNQMIERVEIVKGPASALYGAEAVGGLINIITKNPQKAPLFTADFMATSWQEYNADIGFKIKTGAKVDAIAGLNYFNYQQQHDLNNDVFTDVANQHRVSIFTKWQWQRKENRLLQLAARYFYEDRWGGDIRWQKKFRGTDSIYGESIFTARGELLGTYQLPVKEKLVLSFSYNYHQQLSYYGTIPYNGKQQIGFAQITWNKRHVKHDLLLGLASRFNYYDDNSTATRDTITFANKADKVLLPGIFLQDQIALSNAQQLLLGFRYDHHPVHGNIITPRIAYKLALPSAHIFRINAGTGFRVVNLFTEDHAALTGSRVVEITSQLQPERSYNMNVHYEVQKNLHNGYINFNTAIWYTHFTNQIQANYDIDPNKIVYANLNGYAISRGISLNADWNFKNRFKMLAGFTWQHISKVEKQNGRKIITVPVLTEKWSANWLVSYSFKGGIWSVDYTGNVYGPMRLPLAGALDPRLSMSPVWSIQNIQCVAKLNTKLEFYGGIKNLLNWTPARKNPFIIARSFDPFDKGVSYTADGNIEATPQNPYALSFDPTYVYAPNQGIRLFLGVRFTL